MNSSPSEPRCPACGAGGQDVFHEQRGLPIHSCLMVATEAEARDFPRGDLRLAFCPQCAFIHNAAFEPERMRYSADYEETQGYSPRFQAFLDEQAEDMVRRHGLEGRTALEIGCGKGEFLVLLCEKGVASGIGLDPSYRPERTRSPVADRLRFLRELYSEEHADLHADFVCCRHTLEHIADVRSFMETVRRTVGDRPHTVVFFELPESRRILREQAFWDTYYEHCSYFTPGSLSRLFRRTGFQVDRLALDYDDQYLLLEARPADGPVDEPAEGEEAVAEVAAEVERFRRELPPRLAGWRRELEAGHRAGRRLVLWGSGSKAVAYLNALQVGEEVAAVVDINPHKHGKFLAGTGHRIVAPEELISLRPDRVLVMNPVYVQEIGEMLGRLGLEPGVTAL